MSKTKTARMRGQWATFFLDKRNHSSSLHKTHAALWHNETAALYRSLSTKLGQHLGRALHPLESPHAGKGYKLPSDPHCTEREIAWLYARWSRGWSTTVGIAAEHMMRRKIHICTNFVNSVFVGFGVVAHPTEKTERRETCCVGCRVKGRSSSRGPPLQSVSKACKGASPQTSTSPRRGPAAPALLLSHLAKPTNRNAYRMHRTNLAEPHTVTHHPTRTQTHTPKPPDEATRTKCKITTEVSACDRLAKTDEHWPCTERSTVRTRSILRTTYQVRCTTRDEPYFSINEPLTPAAVLVSWFVPDVLMAEAEPAVVAFQGVRGAYSEAAARQLLGGLLSEVSLLQCIGLPSFEDVFSAVERGSTMSNLSELEACALTSC